MQKLHKEVAVVVVVTINGTIQRHIYSIAFIEHNNYENTII